ncbi:MAG: TetR/AcrR family transcriptional regulator [Dermatophilaceae bacterium]|nr:TetR/AcrR family transcriptional regulator [Intrasporangiaceae bacterium]
MTQTVQTEAELEPTSRRELNKTRTREAIVEALRTLLRDQPVHRITVEQLADEAGVSRRTFFNYYAGIPAVISEVIGTNTVNLADAIGDFAAGTSPMGRLRETVRTVGIPAGLIEWLALLNCHACTDDATADAFERVVWAEKGAWLEGVLVERLPSGVDNLYLATLATTIMSCFAAAERTWAADREPGAPVDQVAIDDFHRQLDRALAYAENGWVAPPMSTPPISTPPISTPLISTPSKGH